jgi:large subunit ribosomal protein L24
MPGLLHVKKGDTVMVIAGSEKGSRGHVLRVDVERQRVFVERLKIQKRHRRPSQKYPTGGVVEQEGPIHASNVTLICPKCSAAIRAHRHELEDGTVMRRCPECSEAFK